MKRADKARTFEATIACCAHTIEIRWWDIAGDVSDERLEAEAEEHVRASLGQDYRAGSLNHETDTSSATGWWEIAAK